MKTMCCGFVAILVVIASNISSQSQEVIQKLERTYDGPLIEDSGVIRNPTFGFAAEAFIPDCEVWFYGELLEPVANPDDPTEKGVFIKKTATEVTINGKVYNSIFFKPKKFPFPIDPRIMLRSRIIEEAKHQFRKKAKPHPGMSGAYIADGHIYEPNKPTIFALEGKDTFVTVTLAPHAEDGMGYFKVKYDESECGFYLRPKPTPSQGERNERQLDYAFNGLVGKCKPGWALITGSGATYTCPPQLRSKLKEMLAQIPGLAVPTHEDIYGEMMYEMIHIDGSTFDSGTIRDFLKTSKR